MNKIARRSAIAIVLAAILIAGIGLFVIRFLLYSDNWVITSGSPHVYDQIGDQAYVECGVAVDADGNLLLDMRDGWIYTGNETLRKANVHWVGDRESNIWAPALNTRVLEMTGYDTFNGMYSYGEQVSVTHMTLVAQLQITALEALGEYQGTIAVINYETGEILCSVSNPTFDPDNLPDETVESMYVNRFTEGLYVPGSVFKLVTLTAAMETMPEILEQTFVCQKVYEFSETDRVTCEAGHGTQTVKQAFSNSCNCVFAQIALQVGPENLEYYAEKFGITKDLQFDGITTATGHCDAVGEADVNIAWSGIGQHNDLINPCTYLAFVATIANDGRQVSPYLVEQITIGSEVTYQVPEQEGDRIISSETAALLQEYLRNNAVSYGADRFGNLTVGAKTGTAQIDGQEKSNAMLVGFVTDPRYPLAFIVCAENAGYGGQVCIPMAQQVLDACKVYMDEAG